MSDDPKAPATEEQSVIDLMERQPKAKPEDDEATLNETFGLSSDTEDVRSHENVHMGSEGPDEGSSGLGEDAGRAVGQQTATETGGQGDLGQGTPAPDIPTVADLSAPAMVRGSFQQTAGDSDQDADGGGGRGFVRPGQGEPGTEPTFATPGVAPVDVGETGQPGVEQTGVQSTLFEGVSPVAGATIASDEFVAGASESESESESTKTETAGSNDDGDKGSNPDGSTGDESGESDTASGDGVAGPPAQQQPDPDVVFTLDNSQTSTPDYADDVVTVEQSGRAYYNDWDATVTADTDLDDDGTASIAVDDWNSVKNVRAEGEAGAEVSIDNFVRADVDLSDGTGDSTVFINDAKRGKVETADGDDKVSIEAETNGSGWDNTFTVDTGGGDDTITATGDGGHTHFAINTGEGADTVTVDGNYRSSEVHLDGATQSIGGDDTFEGGIGDDLVTGGGGDDVLDGGAGDDRLFGDSGDDILLGGLGDDTLTGGRDNDRLSGGEGNDTAVFSGAVDQYDITVNADGTTTVVDTVEGRDGTDTLDGIELFQFSDGTLDRDGLMAAADPGPTLTGVADAVRVTNVNDLTYTHNLDGNPTFPDLSENTRLDPTKVNGVSPDSLTLKHDHDVSVTFVSEGAGYHNSLGWYTIDQDTGAIDNVQFVYGDATDTVIEKAGTETVTLTPPEGGFEGKTLGFFLVPNGHNKNKTEDFWDDASKNEGGKLSFVDKDDVSVTATTATKTPRLIFTDDSGDIHEIASEGGIYHSAAADEDSLGLNPDTLQHAISGVQPDGENLMVGFEDLKGGGDSDYNDLVFTVNVGAENAREMVPTTVAPKLDVDAGASGTITGATVAISEGLKAGDELHLNGLEVSQTGEIGQTGITLTRAEGEDGGTVLQFSGEADADTYTGLLGRVTLKNASDSPETGERTITFEVEDGAGKSVSQSASVNVTDGSEEPAAATDDLSIVRGAAQVGQEPEALAEGVITGTDDHDVLNGTQDDDTIFGAGGDDTLSGNSGDDVLDGGAGSDQVDGGQGDDTGVVFLKDREEGGTTHYDGGDGVDTLRIVVDDASMGDADKMSALWDLDQAIADGNGDDTFDALGLEVNDWESLELVDSKGDALSWVEGSERPLEINDDIANLDDLHSPATPKEDPINTMNEPSAGEGTDTESDEYVYGDVSQVSG